MVSLFKRIFFVCGLISAPNAFGQNLVRPTDTLHFDIREVVNFGARPQSVAVSIELCGAVKSSEEKPRVFCKLIDQSTPIAIDGRATDQKMAIKKFENGVQTKRHKAAELSKVASQIVEIIELATGKRNLDFSQIDFRFGIKLYGANNELLDTQFSALPSLEMEAPASERGLLINRHEIFSADRILKTRVLVVITRRGSV